MHFRDYKLDQSLDIVYTFTVIQEGDREDCCEIFLCYSTCILPPHSNTAIETIICLLFLFCGRLGLSALKSLLLTSTQFLGHTLFLFSKSDFLWESGTC